MSNVFEDLPVGDPDTARRLARLVEELRALSTSSDAWGAFDELMNALASLPEEPAYEDHALCLLLLGRHAYFCGNIRAAFEPIRLAVSIARRTRNQALLAKALKLLATMYWESNASSEEAILTGQAALVAARKSGEATQESEILSNLGQMHLLAGNSEKALGCFDEGMKIFPRLEARDAAYAMATLLGNYALAHMERLEFDLAIEAARKACALLPDPADSHASHIRSFAEAYLAQCLLVRGHVPEARAHIANGRRYAEEAGGNSAAFVEIVEAVIEVYEPTTRVSGLTRLNAAVQRGRQRGIAGFREGLATIARLFDALGAEADGLGFLKELAKTLRLERDRGDELTLERQLHRIEKLLHSAAVARALQPDLDELHPVPGLPHSRA